MRFTIEAMAKSKKAKRRARRDRRKLDAGYIRARVFENQYGFRIVQAGRNLIWDRSQMSPEDQARMQNQMRRMAFGLPKLVAEDASEIRRLIGELPTLPALCCLAFLTYAIDPETYVEWEQERTSNEVEWPTRVALSLARPIELDADRPVLDPEKMQQLIDAAQRLNRNQIGMIASEFIRRNRSEPNPRDLLVERARLQQLGMRVMAYPHQQADWLRRLFAPMSERLIDLVGFDIEEALAFTDKIGDLVNKRINDHLARGRENRGRAREFIRAQGSISKAEEDSRSAALLVTWITTFADAVFLIGPSDLSEDPSAKGFLDQFSLSFGQPDPGRPGPVPGLLMRPLVKVSEESYLCHIPLLLDAIRPNLEATLKAHPAEWETYEDVRAQQLESAAANLWREAIPKGTVDQNLVYTTADNIRADLDVMCRVDRTLVLCECKSGSLPSAQRQTKMLTSLRRVLGRAHSQALRAKDHIENGDGSFTAPDGRNITVDRGAFDRIILAVVTLDDVSAFTTNMVSAVNAGVFKSGAIPWAVSITDFEIMTDIAEFNFTIPHYLLRRSRIADWDKFTAIEELDWFMHYLKDGLWFADDLETAAGTDLMSFTAPLDDYYLYKYGPRNSPAPKPAFNIGPEYRQLLTFAELSNRHGWFEAALLLAQVDGRDQEVLVSFIRDLYGKSRPAGRAMFAGDALVALYSEAADPGMLLRNMKAYASAHAIKRGVRRAVVIGLDTRDPGKPPLIRYLDRRFDHMPTTDEADVFLAQFTSTEVPLASPNSAAPLTPWS